MIYLTILIVKEVYQKNMSFFCHITLDLLKGCPSFLVVLIPESNQTAMFHNNNYVFVIVTMITNVFLNSMTMKVTSSPSLHVQDS